MAMRLHGLAVAALISSLSVGCAGNPGSMQAEQCSNGLSIAYDELRAAETNGFSESVEWTKAASLLTAAKVQYEFAKYPNCIDKVNRARVYISRAGSG
jgi:hypothetical protein